jgi:hypothetical protein
LFQQQFYRMPVIGIARKRPYRRNNFSPFLPRYDYSYFISKLILLMSFPFTDTPREGFMRTVYLVCVLLPLVYRPPV